MRNPISFHAYTGQRGHSLLKSREQMFLTGYNDAIEYVLKVLCIHKLKLRDRGN